MATPWTCQYLGENTFNDASNRSIPIDKRKLNNLFKKSKMVRKYQERKRLKNIILYCILVYNLFPFKIIFIIEFFLRNNFTVNLCTHSKISIKELLWSRIFYTSSPISLIFFCLFIQRMYTVYTV